MLRFWQRRRAEPVTAELAHGFWASEALALQRSILMCLTAFEKRNGGVDARVQFTAGAEGRVVVLWQNRIVGFVPPDHVESLHAQLGEAAPGVLVAPGRIREYKDAWRVWIGPEWDGGRDDGGDAGGPEEPIDELGPPQATILGVPLKRR